MRLTDRYPKEHRDDRGTLFSKVPGRHSGWVVVECECRARLTPDSEVVARHSSLILG
jgi:hypothetical protein